VPVSISCGPAIAMLLQQLKVTEKNMSYLIDIPSVAVGLRKAR